MTDEKLIIAEINHGSILVSGIEDRNSENPLAYTGDYLSAWTVPEGTMFRIGSAKILLGIREARQLRDWLREASYDLPIE